MSAQWNLVSVIVPALNESKTLEELYRRIGNVFEDRQPFEFIVIDDGSTDGSIELLQRMHDEYGNVRALRHGRSHGKSLALMQGFNAARGDVAVLMDGDLQDVPEEIPKLLDKLAEGYDLVNGWRKQRRDTAAKHFVSHVFNTLTHKLLGCPLHDINCGFKAMRREVYQRLDLNGDLHRLIPAIAINLGFRVTEVPVVHVPRAFGKSRYRLLRHRGLLDILALAAANATQSRPFHVFTELSVIFYLLAGVSLAAFVALRAFIPAPAPIVEVVTLVAAISGVWNLCLGTVLPIFGLHLDFLSRKFQDRAWRDSLVQTTVGMQHEHQSVHTRELQRVASTARSLVSDIRRFIDDDDTVFAEGDSAELDIHADRTMAI